MDSLHARKISTVKSREEFNELGAGYFVNGWDCSKYRRAKVYGYDEVRAFTARPVFSNILPYGRGGDK